MDGLVLIIAAVLIIFTAESRKTILYYQIDDSDSSFAEIIHPHQGLEVKSRKPLETQIKRSVFHY